MITILGINNITTPTPRPFSLIHTRTAQTHSHVVLSHSLAVFVILRISISLSFDPSQFLLFSLSWKRSLPLSLFLFPSLSLPLSLRRGWHNPLHRVPLLRLMLLSHSLTCTQCCCYRSDHFHCLLTVTSFQTGSLSSDIFLSPLIHAPICRN